MTSLPMTAMTAGKKQKEKPVRAIESVRKNKGDIETQKSKDAYLLWRSMPALLRRLPLPDLKAMGYEIEDPIFLALLGMKTQNSFCEHFGISVNQPSRWMEDEKFCKQVEDACRNDYILKFEKEIDFSFTQSTIRNPDAGKVKLWKQVYKGWNEKIEHLNTNRNIDLLDLVHEIEKRNAQIKAKNQASALSPTPNEEPLQ